MVQAVEIAQRDLNPKTKVTPMVVRMLHHRRFWSILLGFLLLGKCASGIVFERRERPEPELSYFVYPIMGSIPGVQDFYGVGTTVSAIGGSDVDITYIRLMGDAKRIPDGNFEIDLLTVLDAPIWSPHLTASLFYVDIRNGTWPEGERGINSDPNRTYYLLASKVWVRGAELSTHFFRDQLEIYFGFADAAVKPYGLVDPDDTFYTTDKAQLNESPRGYRYGIYLDDTDDRHDPRIGYRVQWERWDMPASRGENSSFYQDDYNITGFIPVLAQTKGVLVLNQFFGTSTVRVSGTVDQSRYQCPAGAAAGCQAALDELYERQVAEAKLGKATTLGGTQRLRGYRTNRFYDSYTNFQGVEFRWYVTEAQEAFDVFVEKGVYAGLQLAAFWEQGTVSPNPGRDLWRNFRTSYGLGARFLFNTVVLRLDLGFSREGSEGTVYIGYPF